MTKAEFIAAIADAPDDAEIYIDLGKGIWHAEFTLDLETNPPNPALEIVLTLETDEDEDDEKEHDA